MPKNDTVSSKPETTETKTRAPKEPTVCFVVKKINSDLEAEKGNLVLTGFTVEAGPFNDKPECAAWVDTKGEIDIEYDAVRLLTNTPWIRKEEKRTRLIGG